jgi:hypothetical protein
MGEKFVELRAGVLRLLTADRDDAERNAELIASSNDQAAIARHERREIGIALGQSGKFFSSGVAKTMHLFFLRAGCGLIGTFLFRGFSICDRLITVSFQASN